MSIYIKGMEMPENCIRCPLRHDCPFPQFINRRSEDCPLVEIPPHGRLIDADAFALIVQKWRYMYQKIAAETNDYDIVAMAAGIDEFLNSVSLTLEKLQTIIPAGKEEPDGD